MGLSTYKKKRDFGKTEEPSGGSRKSSTGALFVIQKHDASRLHYDLRLEQDGVLRSWAVPKGPCLDPSERRLAVEVEDHPIDYGSFEGIIPKGEYGGGTVMVWDRGTWSPKKTGRRKSGGEIKFELNGEKLRGGWTLARMKTKSEETDKNWLLIKERDEHARPLSEYDILEEEPLSTLSGRNLEEIAEAEPASDRKHKTRQSSTGGIPISEVTAARKSAFPKEMSPQLGQLAVQVPEGEDWIHELKYDGYRAMAFVEKGRVRLITRGGKDWTSKFSPVAMALESLGLPDCVLDGEMVILDEKGLSHFQDLQNFLKNRKAGNLVYYVFDLPYFNGFDLTKTPLWERKNVLQSLLAPAEGTSVRYSDHVRGHGRSMLEAACRSGAEGIVSKRIDSGYVQKRSPSWVKAKCSKGQEFVIGGYTNPSGTRSYFGALLLGFHDEEGKLRFAGKVGTGFDEARLKDIHSLLSPLERKSSPFADSLATAEKKGVHWVAPKICAEVVFTEWTSEGRLRHPSFKGIRKDKDPREIVREIPAAPKAVGDTDTPDPRGPDAMVDQPRKQAVPLQGIRLTHPDRVLYPEQGVTKNDLAEYYVEVQQWILPHLLDRPLSLVRCPQGRQGDCFYQKHLTESLPEALQGVEVTEEKGAKRVYVRVQDFPGLIGLVQIGVLEIHPWGSKRDKLEHPDRMIFDIDPGPGTSWEEVVQVAVRFKALFEEIGWRSFLKTSGGKGLHVYVPLTRRADWEEVKAFAKAAAQELAQDEPTLLLNMSKRQRQGRIFLDYLRNSRGATCVAPYSTRARAGAPVSTPLFWEEIEKVIAPDQFTVSNIPKRIADLKEDPWKDLDRVRQSITREARRRFGL